MLIIPIYSILSGLGGAYIFFKYGHFFFLDLPDKRSSHSKPVVKGGGVGLLVAFFVTSILVKADPVFVFSVAVVSIMGLLGDSTELSPLLRLSVQLVLSFLFAATLIDPGAGALGWSMVIFWSVFIAATANFFNFMDGIDGIETLTGITAFFLVYLFLFVKGSLDNYAMIAVSVLFACLGFLPFNFPRAKVFMGDTGSLLLGFLFACFVSKYSESIYDFSLMVSFVLPFYADVLSTMALRVQKKENLLKPHRRHLYQLLVNEHRVPHWKVSLIYAFLQTCIGLSLIYIYIWNAKMLIPVICLILFVFTVLSVIVRKKKYE